MSQRRKKGATTSKLIAYISAGIVHALIIGIMVFNFASDDDTLKVDGFDAEKVDIVKARAVDEDQLQKTRDEIKKKERAKQRQREKEEKRLRDLRRKAEQEKKRLADLREKNKAAEEAERQRIIALEKKKKEDELKEKKRKEKEEREAKEKRIKDAQAKRDAEQRQREREELQKRLLDEETQRRAAAEQRAAAQRTTTAESRAIARIGAKISQAFRVDPALSKDLVSVVRIKVSPSGEVESVRTIESSGDITFDKSGERAVWLASPLPIPTEQEDLAARARFLEQEFEFELLHPFARR